jgi:HEAT repeat protein
VAVSQRIDKRRARDDKTQRQLQQTSHSSSDIRQPMQYAKECWEPENNGTMNQIIQQFGRLQLAAMSCVLVAVIGGCGQANSPPPAPVEPKLAHSPPAPVVAATVAPTEDRPTELERRYDGLTLAEWRQRIKDLDPNDPAAAQAVWGLMEIAGDSDVPRHTRRQAALTLGLIGPPAKQAVPLFIKLLDETGTDENATSRWAAKALALFGVVAKSAAPVLIQRLKDKSAHLIDRMAAVDALSQIGIADAGVVPALIETLSSVGEQAELRVLTAEALAYIGSNASAAVPALLRVTGDKDENLRRAAVAAIGAVGPMADVAVPTLAELLVFDESAAVRDQAADALSRIGSSATKLLTRLLADEDAEVRWRAAQSLGTIRPLAKSAVPALTKALEDGNAEVRINAMEALWAIDPDAKSLIPFLLAEFTNDDRQIRVRAYKLLIAMGEEARPAIERLRKLTGDDRPFVRQTARKALESLTSIDGKQTGGSERDSNRYQ